MQLCPVLMRVHHMGGEAIAALEPADVLRGGTGLAGHHGQIGGLRGIKTEMGFACLQALPTAGHRHHRKQRIIGRDREIMHHAIIGHLEPHVIEQLALGADFVIGHIAGQQALGGIAKAAHVARGRVGLGMGGEGLALHPPVKIGVALRLKADRFHHQRGAVLFQRIEPPAVDIGIGVGRAADLALDAFIIGQWIAIGAEQRPPGLILQLPLVGFGPALGEIDAAVLEAEHRDHAVAVKRDVIAQQRRKLMLGLNAIEAAVHFGRDRAAHIKVMDVRLDPRGGVEAGEGRNVGECCHVIVSQRRVGGVALKIE